MPLLEKMSGRSYLVFLKDLSTDTVGRTFKKALLRRYYPKPGKGGRVTSYIATWKKAWEKMGWKVTVWATMFSGQPQIVTSRRLANGWLDIDKYSVKQIRDSYDEVAGSGAYVRYLEDLDQYVDRIDEEMIELLPDLSSK